jgi:hypothetical protein
LSRLCADFLREATLLIHWPQGIEPRHVDVFVHNEGSIDAPPEVIWANLIDAAQWPGWHSNSADVRIDGGQPGSRGAWASTGRRSASPSEARSMSSNLAARSAGARPVRDPTQFRLLEARSWVSSASL